MDILLILLILAALIWAVRTMWRRRNAPCGGDCSSCSGCSRKDSIS